MRLLPVSLGFLILGLGLTPVPAHAWTKGCVTDLNNVKSCITRREARTEAGIFAASLLESGNAAKKILRVTVPPGMQLQLGTRIAIDQAPPIKGPYAACLAPTSGCVAEYEATPELIGRLKSGRTLSVQAISAYGKLVQAPLPLVDFARAYDGPPTSSVVFEEQQQKFATEARLVGLKQNEFTGMPWSKFCLNQQAPGKSACFTGTDVRHGSLAVVGAVLIEGEDRPSKILRLTLPFGIAIEPGLRLAIDGAAPLSAAYVSCVAVGCIADYAVDADLLVRLKKGKSFTIDASSAGGPFTATVALAGFGAANDGPAKTLESFEAAKKKWQEEAVRRLEGERKKAAAVTLAAIEKMPPPAANAGRRIALVIGNSAYGDGKALLNPKRDAEIMAAALRRVGFQTVQHESDLPKEKLVAVLRAFAREADKADWAVVYFSGHGMEMGGVNYLIPVDAKLETDRDLDFEAVPLEQVASAVDGAKKLRLVLLDACRVNPFIPQMRRTAATRLIGRGFAPIEPQPGMLVVYAARHGSIALDGDGANSPFVTAFVKTLTTPGIEVRKFFDLVRDEVWASTNRRQQPFAYGSLLGSEDFYFVAGK